MMGGDMMSNMPGGMMGGQGMGGMDHQGGELHTGPGGGAGTGGGHGPGDGRGQGHAHQQAMAGTPTATPLPSSSGAGAAPAEPGAAATIPPTATPVPQSSAARLAHTQHVGNAEITATPRNLGELGATSIIFDLVLETHSGELPAVDGGSATLRIGDATLDPVSWDQQGAGHHATGVLTFSLAGTNAQAALARAGGMTLALPVVNGEDVVFEWQLP
jgi:hypothetical protein